MEYSKQKWNIPIFLEYSKKSGIKLEPSEENNKFLADTFNKKEVENFALLLNVIEKKKLI